MDQTSTTEVKDLHPTLFADHALLVDALRARSRGYSKLFRSVLLTAAQVIDDYRKGMER